VELYIHSPNTPSWHGTQSRKAQGKLLPFTGYPPIYTEVFPIDSYLQVFQLTINISYTSLSSLGVNSFFYGVLISDSRK